MYTFENTDVFTGVWEHGRKCGAGILKKTKQKTNRGACESEDNEKVEKNLEYTVQMFESGVLLWEQPIDAMLAEDVQRSNFEDEDWFLEFEQIAETEAGMDDSDEDDEDGEEGDSDDVDDDSNEEGSENNNSEDKISLAEAHRDDMDAELNASGSSSVSCGSQDIDRACGLGGGGVNGSGFGVSVSVPASRGGDASTAGSAILESDLAESAARQNESLSTEDSEEDDVLGVGLQQSAAGGPSSALDGGPSFQLGHDVSQILSVDEVDEWDGDPGASAGPSVVVGMQGSGQQHQHDDGSAGRVDGNENDVSIRTRNPKRNRSIEMRPTDLSRGSCASPISARQRVQVLRERDSICDESMAASMSSMSIASPHRAAAGASTVDDSDLNFSARVDADEEDL